MGKIISQNKVVSIVLAMVLFFSFFAYLPNVSAVADTSAKSTTSGFYVDGTKIRDAKGNEFVMRGVNHAYIWYQGYTQTALDAIAAKGANTVRLVLGDGGKFATYTSASEAEYLINLCIDRKMVPILEIHDATGEDSVDPLKAATQYWIDIKDVLKKYEKYVIVNIANEWMGSYDGSGWASGYQESIRSLRDAGINNMLIVDSPGWGQDYNDCINYCKTVFDADNNKNTVISFHMYGSAGKNQTTIRTAIDGVLNNGIPVMVGEFGQTHSDGDVDEYYIMQYCQEKSVGYLGWSWKGNSDGVEYLDIANDWEGNSLSEDWGEVLFYSTNGIANTVKAATIFTDKPASSQDNSTADDSDETVIAQTNISNFGWNENNILRFNLSGYKSAKIVAQGDCSCIQFGVGGNVEWTLLVNGAKSSYGSYTYNFSAAEIAKFSADCDLYIQGQDGTLNTVKIIASNSDNSSYSDSSKNQNDSSQISIERKQVSDLDCFEFTDKMGAGWNLGNTFDAYDNSPANGSANMYLESAWCGVKTTKVHIDSIKNAGFNTIRIPVSWHNHIDSNFNINQEWLARVKEVIDYARDDGMYVILNIHHDNEYEYMFPDYNHLESSKKYVGTIWKQLAEYFKNYDEHLIFETLNEPRLVGSNYEWWYSTSASECKEAQDCINQYNQTAVDAIRAVGGNNANRYIMVPAYCAKTDAAVLSDYKLPSDSAKNRLIVSVHEYIPYNFAMQAANEGGSITYFDENGKKEILTLMNKLYEHFTSNNIPVVIGEFGARNKNDNTQDRTSYAAYYYAAARSRGVTCCWWDNNAVDTYSGEAFGIFDRASNTFSYASIAQAAKKYGKGVGTDEESSIIDSSSKDNSSSKADSSSKIESSSIDENETVIASKNVSDFGWNDNNVIKFNLTGYDSAKIVATGDCGYIKYGVGGAVTWTEIVEGAKTSSGTYIYTFTDEEIAKFSADCELYVQGQDGMLSKVEVIGIKNKTDDSSSKFDSSSNKDISSESDYILDKTVVKHQFKNNGDTIRFIMIADEAKVATSRSGEVEVRVMDMNDIESDPIVIKTNITNAYKTIYAGGQRVTAPEGKMFIISAEASGVSQTGWGALGLFKLDTLYPPRYASLYQNGVFGR